MPSVPRALGTAALCAVLATASGCVRPQTQRWQKIALTQNPDQPLLEGPPQTRGMRSGHVTLAPGAAMHRHSTDGNEEQLLLLHGHAKLQIGDEWIEAQAGDVVYVPPQTPHEVHNEGPEPLEYIFTVAPVR